MGDGSGTGTTATAPAAKATAPAGKATGYGQRAAGSAASAPKAPTGIEPDLIAQALQSPELDHVLKARESWRRLAKEDARLKRVVIGDLKRYCDINDKASPLYQHRRDKIAVGQLFDTGFDAWTNSSKLVLVSRSLFEKPPEVAEILLRHEAAHVVEFGDRGDRPPTYHEMALAELKDYTETLDMLRGLPQSQANDAFVKAIHGVVTFFADLAKKKFKDDLKYRDAMVSAEMLPPKSGKSSDSLYVR